MIPIERVECQDFAMEYFRFGSGARTMVILPGLSVQSVMGSAEAVAAAYASFAEDYTVYVFDRRETLPEVYSVPEMARDTAEAMKALGLKDTYLFGASQGGMMALVIAIEYPALVKKLVLGSTSAHVLPEQFQVIERWIALAEAKDPVGLYLAFGEEIYPPAVFEQFHDALIAAGRTVTEAELRRFITLARGIEGFDVSERVAEIACPVLAIGVYEDAVLDSDATMEIAEKLDPRPDFRLYLYMGYGHAAFDTAPDYRERMRKFFEES
ncbi:MAG: alpha/beta hydrolase [Oscillospiraceae bacterium]|nr:alpha/beta hydrolase [Oscillospiraceae bacterium]